MAGQTQRALAQHSVSGECYIVEWEAVWTDGECTGSRITLAAGPIVRHDLQPDGGPWQASRELFDQIDRWPGLASEDAAWLQAEEDAGRLSYPVGAR